MADTQQLLHEIQFYYKLSYHLHYQVGGMGTELLVCECLCWCFAVVWGQVWVVSIDSHVCASIMCATVERWPWSLIVILFVAISAANLPWLP